VPNKLIFNEKTLLDDGSPLGRFWYKIFKDEKLATIGTRTTLAILASLAMLPLYWISSAGYLIGAIALVIGMFLISWKL
jgi:hypothetical protein